MRDNITHLQLNHTMVLCDLCQTISHQELPPYPEEYECYFSAGDYFFPARRRDSHQKNTQREPLGLGLPHHSTLESLRQASAAGCEICRLIETQVDGLLDHIETYGPAKHSLGRAYPLFDLWLTKRPYGGDGFWVLTNSTHGTGRVLLILAAVIFSCDDGDPLAAVFRGRPAIETLNETARNRIERWVVECHGHEHCSMPPTPLPTRLIDLGSQYSGDLLRLVEPDRNTRGHYIALSYCWGEEAHITTTRSDLEAKKKGIQLEALPRAFQEAIPLARGIGIRYLWIDSLCICQDDPQDWERESANMAAIYKNSYLTFSATGAKNASMGLFFPRKPRSYVRFPYTTNDIRGHVLACTLPLGQEVFREINLEMAAEPLSQRAWGLQERLLSQRVLHFASDKMYFECMEWTVSEDGIEIPIKHDCIHHPYAHPSLTDTLHLDALEQWYSLVSRYGSRKLTFPSDKLPAMSGIARDYSEMLEDSYFAGLWRNSMLGGLAWQSGGGCKAVSDYRAPSWSWASVDGAFGGSPDQHWHPLASILDCHVDVDGENPYGRVRAGWIKIEAPLIPLTLSDTKGPVGNIRLRTGNGDQDGAIAGFDTISRDFDASSEMVKAMSLYVLVLADISADRLRRNLPPRKEPLYTSLVITSAGLDMKAMKRVGWMLLEPNFFGPDELSTRSLVALI